MKYILASSVIVLTAIFVLGLLPAAVFAQCPCVLNCPAGDGGVIGPPPPGGNKSPDLNGDGVVNLVDLAQFAAAWPPSPYDFCVDFNCDGIINLPDLALFAAHWAHAGPIPGFCQPGIDHYKTYETMGPIFDGPIVLKDQFGEAMVSPLTLQKFSTPVSKNLEPICDQVAHQSWWQFRFPEPPRTVVVQNQFGTFEWQLGDAVYLIMPALKFPEAGQEIPVLNHYMCYDAQGPSVDITVRLRDQFGDETVVVMHPVYFCNPCQKQTPDGTVYPIIDNNAHITVYFVDNPLPHDFQILMRDQFLEEGLILLENLYLEVPAVKKSVNEPVGE